MAFNQYLEERINRIFEDNKIEYTSKKMFGGLCFLIKNKMVVGIVKDELMARIGKDIYEQSLEKQGVRKMDFTGKEMKGYVFVNSQFIDTDNELEYWLDLALKFNKTLILNK